MLKLELLNGKSADDYDDDSNRTTPSEYDKYVTMLLKPFVAPFSVRLDRVVAADYCFLLFNLKNH